MFFFGTVGEKDRVIVYLLRYLRSVFLGQFAGPHSAVCSASNSGARGPGFDTWSGHILSFILPLIQEGQLSVTGESIAQSTG